MIKISEYICTSVHIYTFMVCTDGTVTCMYVPLAANSSTCYWVKDCVDVMFICADILEVFMYLCPCLHVTLTVIV